MKNSKENNIETIKLKDVPETKKSNDYEIPSNINSYFQSIDLKDLASYQDNIFEEINNSDTLFGNNYFKYFMKNKLLPKKSCFKEIIHLNIIHTVFPYMQYLLTIFYLMNFLNHAYIVFLNPGIPSPDNFSKNYLKTIKKEDRKFFQVCEICNIIVDCDDDVRHCTECNICVKKMDHHCYWTGKCIAKNNYLTFQLFTFTTLLYYVWYAIVFVVWYIIKAAKSKHKI